MFWIFLCVCLCVEWCCLWMQEYGHLIKFVLNPYHKFEMRMPLMWSLPPEEIRKRIDKFKNVKAHLSTKGISI
jgi:hypothetical protein